MHIIEIELILELSSPQHPVSAPFRSLSSHQDNPESLNPIVWPRRGVAAARYVRGVGRWVNVARIGL